MKYYLLLSIIICCLGGCTTYDAVQDLYPVQITLSAEGTERLDSFPIQLRNSLGTTFSSYTDSLGTATFSLPAGIYQCSTSRIADDSYFRTVYNGSLSDLIVGGNATSAVSLPLTITTLNLSNPLLIKELYIGGCQKDDGSGNFFYDKCIILYNNSSHPVSLDSVAFGMIEPYNAEANLHSFLNNGVLQYASEDWIPAINGIWYFQDGQQIEPYSQLVVCVTGAIDNTQTYSNSINYANPSYYCMYDMEAKSSDGKGYTNTNYYPSPSELIPTSHYLKAVKYGQSNAWPLSNYSPAIILFRSSGATPKEYASNATNLVYPSDKQGNLVYACLRVKRSWILDAVEVYNALKPGDCKKRLTPDIDNGYILHTYARGHSLIRKVEKTIDGHPVYQDTNNSTDDFYESVRCSLK